MRFIIQLNEYFAIVLPLAEEKMAETVTLTYQGKTYELPLIEGSTGEQAIDITKLRKTTGLITFDPGFMSTGSKVILSLIHI